MLLDLRFPLGLLFLLIGALIGATGAIRQEPISGWTGAAMLAFSAFCLIGAVRARRAGRSGPGP